MTKTKITKKMIATALASYLEENFKDDMDIILNPEDGEEVAVSVGDSIEYLRREIALLSKKKSSGNSKKAQEIEAIKAEVVEALQGVEKVTVTELTVLLENKYSGQKLNPILKKLMEEGKVERTTEKRKVYYSLIG